MDLSLDFASLRRAYTQGGLTPTRLVREVYRRIATYADDATWIHLLPCDAALAAAERVEARGPADLPLYGLPFAIKDNIDLANIPTTAGCPAFAYVPPASASVVQRLIEAGAIPIGKTNLDQFATGLVGVRSPYGVPRNPFRAEVIPGGSSSGSAVAVAAGLVSFALGTDTAGSGRVPAGFNNLVGLKPTRGAWSTRGLVPACRALDCLSVFTLTCADAEAIREVVEGFDPADSYSRRPAARPTLPARCRIGVPAAAARSFFGDTEAAERFAQCIHQMEALGHDVREIDYTPFAETAALLYQGPWVAERWAALRAFHGQRADDMHPVIRGIVEAARALDAADAFAGLYRLAELRRATEAAWAEMDVLMVPTAPRPYTVAEVQAEPLLLNSRLGTYTNFVNLLDLSALALPAGMRRDGLPHGVTLIAPAWAEPALLRLGERWHAAVDGRLGATAYATPAPSLPALTGEAAPVALAVVGAHLEGLPLNHQLRAAGARLQWVGRTAPQYRLFVLPGATPPKPGLLRVAEHGSAIHVEVWEMDAPAFGEFVAQVPSPLSIGTLKLADGRTVKGFLCEPVALVGAEDITHYGGWRAYLARSQ